MNERAYLHCRVIEEKGDQFKLRSDLQDGTEFEVVVNSQHLVEKIANSKPPACWLLVQFSGEQNEVATITLPAPIIDKGHRITVKTNHIQRILAPVKRKIKQIKLNKGVEGANSQIHQFGEILNYEMTNKKGYWIIIGHGEGFTVPFDCAEVIK
jgi:hypothetical protein